jgi:putative transposase
MSASALRYEPVNDRNCALKETIIPLATTRGLPMAIRTDNCKEFCGRDMLNWAHSKGVQLFLI